jgi:hypothetical protein
MHQQSEMDSDFLRTNTLRTLRDKDLIDPLRIYKSYDVEHTNIVGYSNIMKITCFVY